MAGIASREALGLWALLGLALGAYALSRRYYTSAAFEHPIYFSVLTLNLTGWSLRSFAKWTKANRRRQSLDVLHAPRPKQQHARRRSSISFVAITIDTVQRLNSPFLFLLVSITARSLLFWWSLHNAPCAVGGLEAFLPLFVLVFDALVVFPRLGLPLTKSESSYKSGWAVVPSVSALGYGAFSIAWAFATMAMLDKTRVKTGAVCPMGWWPVSTPWLQIVMCGLDAAIIVYFSRLRNLETTEDCDVFVFMAALLFAAGGLLSLVSVLPIIIESELLWTLRLSYLDLRDLVFDSSLATLAILCSLALLTFIHPTTVALVVASFGLYGFRIPELQAGLWLPPLPIEGTTSVTVIGVFLLGALLSMYRNPENSANANTTVMLHRWLLFSFVGTVSFSAAYHVASRNEPTSRTLSSVVNQLVSTADTQTTQWAAQAARSKSLKDAVAEYERRYSMPPPPNFDKWYEYATLHDSPVIDDFGQIHKDLLPFWGLKPVEIRDRTTHLLRHSSLEMGGIRIRNGALEQSPHIPGTHRWMVDTIDNMVKPFAQWLPDMDIAINLSDECRVAVPFEEMNQTLADARKAEKQIQNTIKSGGQSLSGWPRTTSWPKNFPEPSGDFYDLTVDSPYFTDNIRRQLYYDWIAPTCHPNSLARNSRWWDRSTACAECAAKHSALTSDGTVVVSDALAADLCHQPDMAYLDGFVMSPTMVGTHSLFPVFSQGRVGGFSDILFPSPWNFFEKSPYEEDTDVPWEQKRNSLFWRGSGSDGYAWSGSWTGFGRARLVHESHEHATATDASTALPHINVTFTGDMAKCHQADCAAELASFSRWSKVAEPETPDGRLPSPTNFQEHWQHRHLIDMDGAGFSGRFLPFLRSRSLVYRAALFRAWFDERLHEWHHYVPVDVRLGGGFWSLLEYLSGRNVVEKGGAEAVGGDVGAKIAQNGRDWAKTALRHEDMQIYMFRLLLEWGRVVDDDRERLGFSLT